MMGVECLAGLPVFDVILLGLGPDGHVASLFPNRSQLAATDAWVLPIENSPKPPPERITFSLPVINRFVTHPPPLRQLGFHRQHAPAQHAITCYGKLRMTCADNVSQHKQEPCAMQSSRARWCMCFQNLTCCWLRRKEISHMCGHCQRLLAS